MPYLFGDSPVVPSLLQLANVGVQWSTVLYVPGMEGHSQTIALQS